MLKGAITSSTTSAGLPSTPNLIRHVTEIQAILNSDSRENDVHSSIFANNKTQTYISTPTASPTSDSSSSPITVLLTNERDDGADVISEISSENGGRRAVQNLMPSISRNPQGYSPNYPQSKMSQLSRMAHHSRQESQSPILLKRIRTTLWIDRALFLLGVIIPLSLGSIFFLVHSFTDFVSCQPARVTTGASNKFVNQVCRTKLMQVILQGAKDKENEDRVTGSLQHECFPIILILIAILNWIPHLCWHLIIRHSIYCDASLVASELRSFRKTAQRELISIASTISSMPLSSNFMPIIQQVRTKNSGRPTPTQCRNGDELTITEPVGNFQISHPKNTISPVDTGYESEMDLPSAAVMHLPKLRVSRDDHALNLFISGWQKTDFYVRRFLAKHIVLFLFNITTFTLVLILSAITNGEPFSGSFYCRPTEKSTTLHVCLTSTTFALNMTAFCLGALGLLGFVCSLIFFHRNFSHSRVYKESTIACGTKSVLHSDLAACLLTRRDENFFSDYIRLLALARMQLRGSLFVTRREVFNLRLSYLPGITRTDFHFINLLCKENSRQFPDVMQLRVWLLRYVFLCRRLSPAMYSRATSTPNNHIRNEDLSSRLGFGKVRVNIDFCDQYC
ncbi:unnamed protein product [Hymenolepis diminuta]|uniref:Autophagy-related protein 9 n=1 Tax=Hymenolepis diminuta TaxID=6216 RepID=A0A0R3SHY4_HYMDI|nr:unnamed protein product [Hymenolepis diminuta]VUZ43182.1 unnamed protein product [Hymenolepis diminuta]